MLKILIFPPKNLEKNTGAQNTHAPIFLKKNSSMITFIFKFNLYLSIAN